MLEMGSKWEDLTREEKVDEKVSEARSLRKRNEEHQTGACLACTLPRDFHE